METSPLPLPEEIADAHEDHVITTIVTNFPGVNAADVEMSRNLTREGATADTYEFTATNKNGDTYYVIAECRPDGSYQALRYGKGGNFFGMKY